MRVSMENHRKPISLKDIVDLYFSETPILDFIEIEKLKNKYSQELKNYNSIKLPSWVSEKARHASLKTLSFIDKNIFILSPDKKEYGLKEYQDIVKFKTVLKNLNLLKKQINLVRQSYINALSFFLLKIFGVLGLLGILIWGAYLKSDFCFFINIVLIVSIFLLNKSSKV